MHVHTRMHVCICAHMFTHMHMYVCVYGKHVYECVHVYMCESVVHVCICVCVHVCICVSVYMCTCASALMFWVNFVRTSQAAASSAMGNNQENGGDVHVSTNPRCEGAHVRRLSS